MLESEVDSLSCPTQLGEVTILPGHIPLVANLAPGEMKVRSASGETFMFVAGGVLEVKPGNEITVLADAAEPVQEIDIKRAEVARERARKVMAEQVLSEEEYAQTAAALEKSLARLRLAHRKKHRS